LPLPGSKQLTAEQGRIPAMPKRIAPNVELANLEGADRVDALVRVASIRDEQTGVEFHIYRPKWRTWYDVAQAVGRFKGNNAYTMGTGELPVPGGFSEVVKPEVVKQK